MFGIPNPMYDFLLVPGFLIGVGWLLRGLFERWSGADAVVMVPELPYTQAEMLGRMYSRDWRSRHRGVHVSWRDQ